MRVTFFVGNGFDINLGLPTKYENFIADYLTKERHDIISESMTRNPQLWSDMEKAVGDFCKNITIEKAEEFLDNKEKLDAALNAYLKRISAERKLILEPEFANEFRMHITSFYKEFNPTETTYAEHAIGKATESVSFGFVTFNYTMYLDEMVTFVNKKISPFNRRNIGSGTITDELKKPLHIHGTLNDGIILAVNDRKQIAGDEKVVNALQRYMVKTEINMQLGVGRFEQLKQILIESRYICIFGLSIGGTDRVYWDMIYTWLVESDKRRLVLYTLCDEDLSESAAAKVRWIRKKKVEFLAKVGKSGEIDNLDSRIIVVTNSQIFKFGNSRVDIING